MLVITAAHSRFMTARMLPTRKTEDLLLGSWELIEQLGRVPRRLIWDNEPGIGRGARRAEGVASFMGTLATKLVLLPPKDAEARTCNSGRVPGTMPAGHEVRPQRGHRTGHDRSGRQGRNDPTYGRRWRDPGR